MVVSVGRLFRIVGVPGCGKTTMTALISKFVREQAAPFSGIDTKHILCELAGVRSEPEYRLLPEEQRRRLWPELMRRITALADTRAEHIWYFERHLCSMHEDGQIITRIIPPDHGQRMVGQAIITADPFQIAAWRSQDQSVRHDRHQLSAGQIGDEQTREVQLAMAGATEWGFPTHVFFNQPGKTVKLAREIYSFMIGLNGAHDAS